MTEMTMPEATPKGSGPRWNVIVPVAILLIVGCVCLIVTGVFTALGIQGKGFLSFLQEYVPVSNKAVVGDWAVFYDWGCTGTYAGPANMTFHEDLTFSIFEDAGSLAGRWEMSGKTVKFTFDEYPNSVYIGDLDGTYMTGTMTNSDGGSGCWYANR